MTELSNIKPDIEDLIQQLTSDLATKDAWKDLVESGTGQTLIEFMAALGTMQNFNLERSIQENFTDTASIDTSIYTIARMLGVNPRRNASATTVVDLTLAAALAGSITIPELTQFKVEDKLFYNPNEIVFLAGQVVASSVTLEQGEILASKQTSTGVSFQEFVVGQDFTLNENLMQVKVNGELYTRERRSLIIFGNTDKVFLELTMADGSVRIIFGNGTFGVVPIVGASIEIKSAVSDGSSSNTASSGLSVSLIDNVSTIFGLVELTGLSTTGIVGGSNRVSADELRYTAPRLFASAERAITRSDWKVISMNFPTSDIVDSIAFGEFELNSTNNTLMNVVDVVLLPATGAVLTALEKTTYLAYIDDFKHVTTQVVLVDPVSVVVNIDMDVFYFDGVDPITLQAQINQQMIDLFKIQLNSLGRQYHLSDIIDIVADTTGVDYVILNSPAAPLLLNREEFASLGTVSITTTLTNR